MPRTRSRRVAVNTLCALVAAAAAAVVMRPSLLTDHLPDGFAFLGTDTTVAAHHRPTPADPFHGSPAANWSDGAAGIALPEARATGGLSRARVEGALRDTRDFLIAANLDPATLRGERPRAALDLIDPADRTLHHRLDTALAKPSEKNDPLMLFSRFDPAELVPAGPVVKTKGRTTFEAGERPGSVEIHADYTFVYPVVRAEADAKRVERTIVRRVLTIEVADPAAYEVTPGKIWILEYRPHIYNSSCTVFDGYLHPAFPGDAPEPESSGPSQDPYDRSSAGTAPEPGECAPVSRT